MAYSPYIQFMAKNPPPSKKIQLLKSVFRQTNLSLKYTLFVVGFICYIFSFFDKNLNKSCALELHLDLF